MGDQPDVELPIISIVDGGEFCIVYVLHVLCCELGIRNNCEKYKGKMMMEEEKMGQEKEKKRKKR